MAGDATQSEALSALGIPAPRVKRRVWLWVVSALVLLVGLVAVGIVVARRRAVVTYDFAQVHRGDINAKVIATGTLSALTQVDVGAEISGRVARVLVDFNDRVAEGQVLAELDTSQLEAQLRQARASVAQASAQTLLSRAGVHESETNRTRSHALGERGLLASADVQGTEFASSRASAQAQASLAGLALARANLEQAAANLARATIRSPISGMVLRRSVEPGQTVAAALQAPVLFTLAESLTEMRLMVDIDEADIGSVREGQEAEFRVDAYPDRVFHGRITSVRFSPRTVQNVVTYEAMLRVQNPDLLLRPGMTATAAITTSTRSNVWLVPNSVLRFSPPETGFRGPRRRNRDRARGPTMWMAASDPREPPVPLSVRVLASDDGNTAVENVGGSTPALSEGMSVIVDIHREADASEGGS